MYHSNKETTLKKIKIYQELLEAWCDSLIKLQITDIKTEGLYGGILCPSCSRVHGRSSDAIYPLMHMAHQKKEQRYLDAALLLFDWSVHMMRPDGSVINDTSSDWKGITVFSVIQLGEAIRNHGSILDSNTLSKWKARLRSMTEFLYGYVNMGTGNINYPITCSASMAIAGKVLDEPRYLRKGHELAHASLGYFTENHLLYGEGRPADYISPNGCRPVDLGYNVEETIPGLVLYGLLMEDKEVLNTAKKAMKSHLEFMLPDGAWDNSWGTRSFKWSYWGSRTSDGCQTAYALLGDQDPAFAEAAYRNVLLLKECTHEGMLYGGPHYNSRGELPCIHHTFCHAKALATVLDHHADRKELHVQLPRERVYGIREYTEIRTWLTSIGRMRGTVTAYDWEYCKGGHASGGAISMLWHEKAGTLLCGSQTEYQLIEPNNMQIPKDLDHQCLTPRIETEKEGKCYSSINDTRAKVRWKDNGKELIFTVEGTLADGDHQSPGTEDMSFRLEYLFKCDSLEIKASMPFAGPGSHGVFYLPLVSEHQEKVGILQNNELTVEKRECNLRITSNKELDLRNTCVNSRIFNLVPGFEALPLSIPIRGQEEMMVAVEVIATDGHDKSNYLKAIL